MVEPRVDGSIISRDGLVLSTWHMVVASTGLEPVILIHGLGDHSRSLPYLRLGSFLAKEGFDVYAFDRRGSGRSQGLDNYAPSFDDLRDDLSRFVDLVEDRTGRLPSLVGLSFGGLQALDFALASPESLHACVVMAPALDASGTSRFLRRLLPVLAHFFPTLALDPGLDDAALTRDPAVCREYRNDPLWRPRTTTTLATFVLDAIDRVSTQAGHLTTPLLVLHGTADRVVPIHGTREVFPRFGAADKTFVEMAGAFHALPIEPDGDEVAARISAWLKARRAGGPC
jgi:alpha-beta hydrolase superfamily lysophospholipase